MPTALETTQHRPAEVHRRTADRRLAVVDAFIDLVLEGGPTPTAEEVANRAGVSRATFFRYFSTLHELRNEAVTRVTERFPELLTIPDLGTGSLDDRIHRFVDARVRLHEDLHPLELVARVHAATDDETAALVDAVRQVTTAQARQHFGAELALMPPAQRDDIVTAIGVLTSVESWLQFRRTHARTAGQTRRAWRTTLTSILEQTDR